MNGVQNGEIVEGEAATVPIWKEYLYGLLNQQTDIAMLTLREQGTVMAELSLDFEMEELDDGIMQGKNNKSTGASGVPIEVFKAFDEENRTEVLVAVNYMLHSCAWCGTAEHER